MGAGIRRRRNQNSHKARDSNISKRVDKGLDQVAQLMAGALGDRFDRTESSLFWKRLRLTGMRYVPYLDLKYNFENRLMSISYNLELSTQISTDERFKECGSCVYEARRVRQKGGERAAAWRCTSWDGEQSGERDRTLKRLENPLIQDRIVALDMQQIYVSHAEGSGCWTIQCESMIGSATWVLIPPVVSVIKPRAEESVRFAEFFELVADAVANNRV